jgi:hypothetical protein
LHKHNCPKWENTPSNEAKNAFVLWNEKGAYCLSNLEKGHWQEKQNSLMDGWLLLSLSRNSI